MSNSHILRVCTYTDTFVKSNEQHKYEFNSKTKTVKSVLISTQFYCVYITKINMNFLLSVYTNSGNNIVYKNEWCSVEKGLNWCIVYLYTAEHNRCTTNIFLYVSLMIVFFFFSYKFRCVHDM